MLPGLLASMLLISQLGFLGLGARFSALIRISDGKFQKRLITGSDFNFEI
jgi:hypothetical protein